MGIENCANFKTNVARKTDIQYCKVTGKDMKCAGQSLLCPTPKEFIPQRVMLPSEIVVFDPKQLDPFDF